MVLPTGRLTWVNIEPWSSAGQTDEDQPKADDDQGVDRQRAAPAALDAAHALAIALAGRIEGAVEPGEEAAEPPLGRVAVGAARLEDGGAQRRGEGQGHQHR